MKRLVTLCCLLISSTAFAGELIVKPVDHWMIDLECDIDSIAAQSLRARTTIVQPQGFTQVIESSAEIDKGKARWRLVYPLIDEGRFDVQPGNWTGYWDMGVYQLRAELLDGSQVIHTAEAIFDPTSVCQRDNYGPIFSTYPQQFIECSAVRPAYIDTDQMSFTVRTLPERVAECTVVADVTARNDETVLAGPWTIELTGDVQQQDFDSSDWPRGEYWIRVRLQKKGEPVGPYLIRKVWKEILPPEEAPATPLPVGRDHHVLASSHGFDEVSGIRFISDQLQKQPEGPLLVMDKPWETELLYYKTLHYDKERGEYVLEYELAGGDKQREAERAQLPSIICRAISKDGLSWTKPSLGLVEYRGSTDNNLVPAGQQYVSPRPENLPPSLAHDYAKATFRHYEPERDGPVNMQNVFVASVKESFVNQCIDASSHPFRTGAWPMEKRGDEYLVLTHEPILYVGVGMDLFHTTEKITLHVEDKSTGKLYYFFRPGAPSYPPHDAPYDNMHMTRRCIGVMWTSDGMQWDRRLIAVPDENDPPGAQFYYNALYAGDHETDSGRPAMALENHWNEIAVDGGRATLASFTVYDAKANQLWPELATTGDLLHWRRFSPRRKMIPNGPQGSYDHGLIKIESRYHEFNNEWWFPYQAINTLHQDYIGLAKMNDVEQLKREFPNYAQMPGFVNWDQYWRRCKTMRYYTGLARCLPGRVCHAEPVSDNGSLTTGPVVLDGDALLLNADVQPSGSLQVEVLDQHGTPLPGFEWEVCRPIKGDSLDFEVAWDGAELKTLKGQEVRLRFLLDRAKLYSYRMQ
ncbi:MAG: hypothetical protein WD738_04435 [Pirellulales bacterium]